MTFPYTPITNGDSRKNDAAIWNDVFDEFAAILGNVAASGVSGTSAAAQLTYLKSRVDTIVASAGTSNTEIVDARGDESVLLSRLDRIESGLINALAATYGATADGSTDDRSAIASAIDTAITNNNAVMLPAGTYRVSSLISKAPTGSLAIIGAGSDRTTILVDDANRFASIGPSAILTTTLAADAEISDNTITLTSVTGVQRGDLLQIRVTTPDPSWYYSASSSEWKGELHRVLSVSGSVVTLTSPILDQYDISAETCTVYVYRPVTFRLEGVSVEWAAGDTPGGGALSLANTVDTVIRDVHIRNSQTATGLSLGYNYNLLIDGLTVDGYISASEAIGYGVQITSGHYNRVVNSFFRNCRRGVDLSGGIPSRFCTIANCTYVTDDESSSGYSGFGSHTASEDCLFIGNTIVGSTLGIFVRGANNSIIGNRFYNINGTACITIGGGENYSILNNVYYDHYNSRTGISGGMDVFHVDYFIAITGGGDGLVAIGNTAQFLKNGFIDVVSGTYDNWSIQNNNIRCRSNSSTGSCYLVAGTGTIQNSAILGNVMEVDSGLNIAYESTITVSRDNNWYDNLPITDPARLAVWGGGGGTLANVTVDVLTQRLPGGGTVDGTTQLRTGWARVIGRVKFDVITNTVAIRIDNLPQPKDDNRCMLPRETYAQVVGYFLSGSNDLYISSNASNYNTVWAVGTGYEVDIDISYRV